MESEITFDSDTDGPDPVFQHGMVPCKLSHPTLGKKLAMLLAGSRVGDVMSHIVHEGLYTVDGKAQTVLNLADSEG